MKKALSIVGNILLGLLIMFFTIIAIPIAIVALIIIGPMILYGWIWEKIRHDPQRKLVIKELRDDSWQDADRREQFILAFEAACDTLAKLANAKQSSTRQAGFEAIDGDDDGNSANVSLERIIESKHAELKLSFEFTITKNAKNEEIAVNIDEDNCGEYMPAIEVEVVKPSLHIRRTIMLDSDEAAWVVIGFLRGDVRFTHQQGQLWVYVPEHDVWIVQYKNDKDSYGLRPAFTNKVARKYGYDK